MARGRSDFRQSKRENHMTRSAFKLSAPFVAATLTRTELGHIDSALRKTVRREKDSVLVFVPLPGAEEKNRFHIPETLRKDRLSLHIPERYRKDGGAVIVCGFRGRKLRSYFPEYPDIPWYITGWLFAETTAFTVAAFPDSDTVRIVKRSIERTGAETVRIVEDTVYDGPAAEARHLKGYREAIDAAFAKAEYRNQESRLMYYRRIEETAYAPIT